MPPSNIHAEIAITDVLTEQLYSGKSVFETDINISASPRICHLLRDTEPSKNYERMDIIISFHLKSLSLLIIEGCHKCHFCSFY